MHTYPLPYSALDRILWKGRRVSLGVRTADSAYNPSILFKRVRASRAVAAT